MAGVKQFTDELDDLPVTKPVAAAATATAAAPAAKNAATLEEDDAKPSKKPAAATAAAASTEEDDLTVDFGDRELMKKTGLLERLRPEKGKVVRFAMLTDFVKARMAFTHFIDKKGTYRCLADKIRRTKVEQGGNPDAEGYCCKKLKEDAERLFVALVVFYKNANTEDGGLEKGQPLDWELRYVQLTHSNFRGISRLIEEEVVDPSGATRPGTVNDMDIVMSHADKAFGYEFHKKAARPRFRSNPELLAEVKEKLKPFLDGTKLEARLGKTVTELEMKALISGLAAGAEDAKLGDVESL